MKIGQPLILVTAKNKALDRSFDFANDLVFNCGELRKEIGEYSVILNCNNIIRPLNLRVLLVKIIMPEFIKYGVGLFWLGNENEQMGEICLLSDKGGKKELRDTFKQLTRK